MCTSSVDMTNTTSNSRKILQQNSVHEYNHPPQLFSLQNYYTMNEHTLQLWSYHHLCSLTWFWFW